MLHAGSLTELGGLVRCHVLSAVAWILNFRMAENPFEGG
jgi:hypothetical protein